MAQKSFAGLCRHARFVTLDVTNTLIRVQGSVGERYAHVGAWNGIHDVPDAAALNKSFATVWKSACKTHPNFGHGESGVYMSIRDWWRMVVYETFEGAGWHGAVDKLDRTFQQLFDEFSRGDAWKMFDDVRPALKQLKEHGIQVGVISNFDSGLRTILWDLGLHPYFSNVIVSGELPFWKPDRRIFEHALEVMGCHDYSHAVHVGDDMERDVKGCQAIGAHAVLLNRKLPADHQATVCDNMLITSTLADVVSYVVGQSET